MQEMEPEHRWAKDFEDLLMRMKTAKDEAISTG